LITPLLKRQTYKWFMQLCLFSTPAKFRPSRQDGGLCA
jgi:hypothetical protein